MPGCSLVCRFCGQQANKKSIEKHLAFLVKSSPVPYACLVPSIRCQKMDLTLFFSSPNLINLEYNRWAKWNNLLTVPMLTSLAASLPEHKHLLFALPNSCICASFSLQSAKQPIVGQLQNRLQLQRAVLRYSAKIFSLFPVRKKKDSYCIKHCNFNKDFFDQDLNGHCAAKLLSSNIYKGIAKYPTPESLCGHTWW